MKEALKYILIIIGVFILVRGYDYVTKKPVPVDRTENPEIIALNKRIDIILDSVSIDKKKSAKAMENFYLSLDSVKTYRKAAINENKKLKATPDTMLQHRMDSIVRANGR
ncbi:MAG TPA: hypothetical protein PK289_00095 [Bacteroidia bacterium]|nr:hypothetical protein [Bacteroidia bacterium]